MDNELTHISTSWRLQLGYSVGHVLNDVCASLWFTYLQVFFHLVLEFTAAQAGTLMLIGQVVDALATPFVGYCSDNSMNTRYGKRKQWHLFGTFSVLASFPFIFSECLECSTSHKWAQMYYFAAFIVIFQIGWAAVQISHLSLIPELSEDNHTRKQLTVIRYGFTVFSNIFVYIIMWAVLHVTGQCDKEQVGPQDAWKFKNIVYIVLSVGTLASIIFHLTIKEKPNPRQYTLINSDENNSAVHCEFLKRPLMYQVAGVYMSSRMVVNVSQVLIPLYLHKTLGLAARSLAVIPLVMFLGSLSAAGIQRVTPRSCTRKISYVLGALCAAVGFIWIYLDSNEDYKLYYIYVVAVFIGFGGAVMLVTSLALTADLVGDRTEASAFVYGLMSFTDKLACGIAVAVIQSYADGAGSQFYRNTLAWVCGGATSVGLLLTVLLPSFSTTATANTTNDSTASIQSTLQDQPEEPSEVY